MKNPLKLPSRLPDLLSPDETWTPERLEFWLKTMTHWHLLTKRYEIQDGEGDWYYYDTTLGRLVLVFLDLLTRLRLLGKE